jgi:hypothetical protein
MNKVASLTVISAILAQAAAQGQYQSSGGFGGASGGFPVLVDMKMVQMIVEVEGL